MVEGSVNGTNAKSLIIGIIHGHKTGVSYVRHCRGRISIPVCGIRSKPDRPASNGKHEAGRET